MKAMAATAWGGPDVFAPIDLPRPTPGRGELLVRVLATSVNPVDYKLRRNGTWAGMTPPAVLGYDAAGVVEALGDGVDAFARGDAVFYTPVIFGKPGTYAELHVVDAAIVAKKPSTLSYVEAAALPLAGCTAWDALVLRARVQPTETVLIHAGAGGVGSLAVQVAKAAGCRVIATAKTDAHALVRSLGADVVVDHTREDFADATLRETGGRGVDVALDTVGGDALARSIKCTRPRGRLVSIASTSGDLGGAYMKNLDVLFVFLERSGDKIRALQALAERGQIKPVIDSVLPLEDVAKAHAKIEGGGMRGKLVLRVSDDADER